MAGQSAGQRGAVTCSRGVEALSGGYVVAASSPCFDNRHFPRYPWHEGTGETGSFASNSTPLGDSGRSHALCPATGRVTQSVETVKRDRDTRASGGKSCREAPSRGGPASLPHWPLSIATGQVATMAASIAGRWRSRWVVQPARQSNREPATKAGTPSPTAPWCSAAALPSFG